MNDNPEAQQQDDDGAQASRPGLRHRSATLLGALSGALRAALRGVTSGGVGSRLAVVGAVLLVGVGAVVVVNQASQPEPGLSVKDIPALQVSAADVAPGSAAPLESTAVADLAKRAERRAGRDGGPQPQASANARGTLSDWAKRMAAASDIPERVLLSYGNAELAMRKSYPTCKLSWATLAGIGRVESNHGRFADTRINPNGTLSKPIIGVPLNGSGDVATITDTDGGALDGDRRHDRAVGPMQFIPSTWANNSADGNGDGKADPQQTDDAALAAGYYLCRDGRDMATADGWWSGLFSYNRSGEYGQKVFGLADRYAKTAQQTMPGVGR